MSATNTVLNLDLVMAHRARIHSLKLWTFTEIKERAAEALSGLKPYRSRTFQTQGIWLAGF